MRMKKIFGQTKNRLPAGFLAAAVLLGAVLLAALSGFSPYGARNAWAATTVRATHITGRGDIGYAYEFSVIFDGAIAQKPPGEDGIAYFTDTEIWDKVTLNGKTLRAIQAGGTDVFGRPVENAVQVNLWQDETGVIVSLTLYLSTELNIGWGMRLDDRDTLTVPAGVVFPNGSVTSEAYIFEYDFSFKMWRGSDMRRTDGEMTATRVPPYHVSRAPGADVGFKQVTIEFSEDICYTPGGRVTAPKMLDNLYINGKSATWLLAHFENTDGQHISDAIKLTFSSDAPDYLADNPRKQYRAVTIDFHEALKPEYRLKLDGTDEIAVKAGFLAPTGYGLTQEVKFTLVEGGQTWWERYRAPKPIPEGIVYTPTRVESVDDIKVFHPTENPSQYIMLYFDRPASYQSLKLMTVESESKRKALNGGDRWLSDAAIEGLYQYGIPQSMLSNIKIDGKTIKEIKDEARQSVPITNPAWASENPNFAEEVISGEYLGDGWNINGIMLVVHSSSPIYFDLSKAHTLEFLAGLVTPLNTRIENTQKFVYAPEYLSWVEVSGDGESIDYVYLPPPAKEYTPGGQDGCSGAAGGIFVQIMAMCAAVFVRKIGKK
jgi:hypothetical protein